MCSIYAELRLRSTGPSFIHVQSYGSGDQDIRVIRASFSPDGSKIVFMSSRDGKLEVYVMNADGTEVTQLTFTTAPGVSAEAAVR